MKFMKSRYVLASCLWSYHKSETSLKLMVKSFFYHVTLSEKLFISHSTEKAYVFPCQLDGLCLLYLTFISWLGKRRLTFSVQLFLIG